MFRTLCTVMLCHVMFFCVLLTIAPPSNIATAKEPSTIVREQYAFSKELRTISNDLNDEGYLKIVSNMIQNDLEEEWKRIATSDNYVRFRNQHGGLKKINANPDLKQAYEARKRVAEQFLKLMNDSYTALKRPSKVLSGKELENFLAKTSSMEIIQKSNNANSVQVRPYFSVTKENLIDCWPQFRGPSGQGEVLKNKLPVNWSTEKNVRWKIDVPEIGYSSPIIWKDQLFLTTAKEDGLTRELLCFNTHSGELNWKRAVPAPQKTERLYWKNSYASSTPVTDGERVIAFFGNSGLTSFTMNGEQEWHIPYEPFQIMHGPATSPIIFQDMVIVMQDQNRGDSLFVAYHKRTGKIAWQHPRDQNPGWATPTFFHVNDHIELIYNGTFFINGYNPLTGKELWRLEGTSKEAVPNLVAGPDSLFSVSGRNGPVLAFQPGGKGNVTETHLLWKNKRGGPHVPSPAYHQGHLYLATDTGILRCLNAETGKTVWQKRLSGRFSGSPLLYDNLLYFTNEKGVTYVIKAGSKYDLVATNSLDEYTLASPAVANNRLYFRTKTKLYCIEAK